VEKLKFDYKTLEDFTADLDKYNLELPLESDVSLLKQPVQVGNKNNSQPFKRSANGRVRRQAGRIPG